jgi:hypothetical protein
MNICGKENYLSRKSGKSGAEKAAEKIKICLLFSWII